MWPGRLFVKRRAAAAPRGCYDGGMVLNHLAAILFFSGPLFYIGLLLMIDPSGIASLPALLAAAIQEFHRALKGLPSQGQAGTRGRDGASRKTRRALRWTGAALTVCGLLFAIVI